MIESTVTEAGKHNPRLHQMRTSPNAEAVDTETKKEKALTFRRPPINREVQRNTCASTANP